MNRSQGSIYSTFVWRFTNPVENPSFKDFILEPFDAGYMITCIIFVILGSCGMFLNGRALYLFCRSKTVSKIWSFILHISQRCCKYKAGWVKSKQQFVYIMMPIIGEKSIQFHYPEPDCERLSDIISWSFLRQRWKLAQRKDIS